MSKNGLRMVVCLNFDIPHLSPPSSKMDKLTVTAASKYIGLKKVVA